VSTLNESSYSARVKQFQCGELFGKSERCYVAGACLIFFSYVNWLSCLSFDFCVYKPSTLSSLFMPCQDNKSGVLYTPPPFPTDSDGLSSDPANSNGPKGQSVGLPTDSVGLDQIPLLVRSKSAESPLKSP
jgi:hypothetical protein